MELHALHSNVASTRQFPRYAQGNRRALKTCVNNAQTWLAVPMQLLSPIFLAKWRFQPPSLNHACAAHNPQSAPLRRRVRGAHLCRLLARHISVDPAEQTFGKHEPRGPKRALAERDRNGGTRGRL